MTAGPDTIELLERIARMIAGEGHSHGLKPAQWEALRYLARANRFSRTPGALTAYLGSTKGTVSQTVMSLERAGLVVKTGHPTDRRSVRLDLTPAGISRLERDGIGNVRQAFESLSAEEQTALSAGLVALVSARLALTGGRPFGTCMTCRHFARDRHGPGAHHCLMLDERLTDADSQQICIEREAA